MPWAPWSGAAPAWSWCKAMAEKRIAVLVSGGGTNLQALIDAQGRGELGGGMLAAVLSSRADAYALERAEKAGIPGYVVARKDYPSPQAMTIALVEKLKALSIDLVVLAGFLHILPEEMVEIREGDTPEILQRRVMEEAEWKLLPQAVSLFCQAKLAVEGRHVHILP